MVGARNRLGELEIDVDGRETGDPTAIHPFLAEISKDRRKSVDGDIDTGAAALHLAVRCGSGACCHLFRMITGYLLFVGP